MLEMGLVSDYMGLLLNDESYVLFILSLGEDGASSTSIIEAKKARERSRITGATSNPGGDDFISLTVARRVETQEDGPHPESRLMREDDDLGDGDDGMLTIFSLRQLSAHIQCSRHGRVYWCQRKNCFGQKSEERGGETTKG